MVAFTLVVAIACDQPSQSAYNKVNLAATVTVVQATPTSWYDEFGYHPQDPTKLAELNNIGTHQAEIATEVAPTQVIHDITRTAIALTPEELRPTRTPEPVEPSPTLGMGQLEVGQQPGGAYRFETIYWQGIVNNQLTSVGIGVDKFNLTAGETADMQRLVVYSGKFHVSASVAYEIPNVTSWLIIDSVAGTRVRLVEWMNRADSHDRMPKPGGQQYVFDLATRQFVSP